MIISNTTALLASSAIASGLAFHQAILPYEIDFQLKSLFLCYVFSFLSLLYLLIRLSIPSPFLHCVITCIIFSITLFLSILIHRAFFHRTRSFPGPVLAKITKWYAVYLSMKNYQYYKELDQLHQKYGDFVRTGPREISIRNVEAVYEIYGARSGCWKAMHYAMNEDDPNVSLHSSRGKELHAHRRKAWDRAFSISSQSRYRSTITCLVTLFISRLRSQNGVGVDATSWSNYLSFDIMGEISFGKSWGMLETGQYHDAIKRLHDSMFLLAIFWHVPWVVRLLDMIPGAASAMKGFREWCREQLEEKRKALKGEKFDGKPRNVMEWLLTDDFTMSLPAEAINDDSRLVIIAGSDTVSAALTHIIYFMIKNPGVYMKLQRLLDQKFPNGDADFDYSQLSDVPFLDGIINETLRLKPSVPGELTRITPKEGITISGTYIPRDVIVSIPIHSLHRDPRYFLRPQEFIPERWTSESSELIIDKKAFMPFSVGPQMCVAKGLAMMELRIAVARIALAFDLEFEDGEDGRNIEEAVWQTFTLTMPRMRVRFLKRE
ncbi:cytochrome P450 67 [Pyronema omphalodes]|nr:cytochrome P450 67 [Pyronema omphalodes]